MLNVTVVSPEKTLFAGQVDSVFAPGKKGKFEILQNHAPIVSILTEGIVRCVGSETFEIAIKAGFVEVSNNEVSVCIEV